MNVVIGEVLPLALGIAISPMPVIAAILMLLTAGEGHKCRVPARLGYGHRGRGHRLYPARLSAAEQRLRHVEPPVGLDQDRSRRAAPVLAVKQWRGRPTGDAEPVLPQWMKAIDTMTAVKGAGLGFLLSAVNPKNLIMAAGAGVIIGGADVGLATGEEVLVIAIFTAIAAVSVALPVIAYLVASDKMAGTARVRCTSGWSSKNAAVMAVLLLVIGVAMIGKGIGNFSHRPVSDRAGSPSPSPLGSARCARKVHVVRPSTPQHLTRRTRDRASPNSPSGQSLWGTRSSADPCFSAPPTMPEDAPRAVAG